MARRPGADAGVDAELARRRVHRANGSVVGVDANRSVKFYNGASTPTEVLLDINGYYQP